jgi:hypothetical protein
VIGHLQSLYHFAACGTANVNGIIIPQCASGDRSPIEAVIKIIIGVAASLSILFVTIGAFRYAASTGDPTNITKAKNTIIYALLGLVVSITAYGIVILVVDRAG